VSLWVNIFEPRDQAPVRVAFCKLQPPLERAHGVGAKHVLDFVGVFVDVVGGVLHRVGEVELPEPVIAHDLTGALPAGGGEEEDVSFFMRRYEAVLLERKTALPRFLEALAAELRQLARDVPAVPLAFSQGAFAYRPSAYDGWVSVRGSGALDKRSFLAAGPASRAPEVGPSDGSALGALGLASVGLLFVAMALFVVALRRRHAG